MSRTYKNSHVA